MFGILVPMEAIMLKKMKHDFYLFWLQLKGEL